ncbi:MAG: T9SS type A sorting domain-containing protein [candidate division Zixibacteria bacterium]|nr:T9SS type A sorting domain-containing protein [candidate division Zixibacteria bacterium]
MGKWCSAILVLLAAVTHAGDEFNGVPDHTLLWNAYSETKALGDYWIGLSEAGLAVLAYDSATSHLEAGSYTLLDGIPLAMKFYGDVALVRTADDRLHFLDVSGLPAVGYLGQVEPGVTFADFALHGDDIYLSRWFEGIVRYRLEGYSAAVYLDYSRKGVLVTQLDVWDDELLALDKYNGIMRYDIGGAGFGSFVDYLYVPYRAISFTFCDTTLLILLDTRGLLMGQFQAGGGVITDSIMGVGEPERVLATDTLLVVLSASRVVQLIDRRDHQFLRTASISGSLYSGDLAPLVDGEAMVLPGEFRGLYLYRLEALDSPTQALSRPGPITSLEVFKTRLFTGGTANPVDVHAFDSLNDLHYSYTIYGDVDEVKSMDHNGDTLIVLLPQLGRIVFITSASDPDEYSLDKSIFVDASKISEIRFAGSMYAPYQYFIAILDSAVDLYRFSTYAMIEPVGHWDVGSPIKAVAIRDTLLFVSHEGDYLSILAIGSDYGADLLSQTVLTSSAGEILINGDYAVLFEWDDMIVYDCSDPANPVYMTAEDLSFPVVRAAADGDRMFTVGPGGVGLFDVSGSIPQLLAQGGKGGSMLAYEENILATSDGGSVHVYNMGGVGRTIPDPVEVSYAADVSQNYPNPFNGETNIAYELPSAARVEIAIYNVLGRQVKSLADQDQTAGVHIVSWDGTNDAGQPVSSGVYFYKIRTARFAETRKMVLIK